MPTLSLYNEKGAVVGQVELSPKVFGQKSDAALVHEVVVAQRANARRTISNTKTKGEVSGGGKKPWKQKGTGRARQGSIRSPNWVGGGIVFGPTNERNYAQKINKKTKRKAFVMALSDKCTSEKILVLESVTTTAAKTKVMAQMIKSLPLDKTVLMVAPASNPTLLRMVRNIQNVKLVTANTVNLQDVLTYRSLVLLKDAVPVLEKMYA